MESNGEMRLFRICVRYVCRSLRFKGRFKAEGRFKGRFKAVGCF